MTTLHQIAKKSRVLRKARPVVADLAPAAADVANVDIFPPDRRLDPWDNELPAELWPDDTDNFFWTATDDDPELAPDGGDDHLVNTAADAWQAPFAVEPYEPSPAERAEAAETFGQMEAQAHLDRSDRLTLAELVDLQSDFYRSWTTPGGDMLADAMDRLALQVRMTEATTPGELRARVDVLEESARECCESIGWDAARRQCRCEDR